MKNSLRSASAALCEQGLRWTALTLLSWGAVAANAQVYQCNDAQGRTLFSDAPCASGQIGELIQPEPTPQERAAAEQRALQARAAEAAAAERREQERQAREAQERAAAAARPAPLPPPEPPAIAGWEVGTQYAPHGWNRPRPHPALGCETARQDAAVVQANRNVLPTERHRQLEAAQARVQMACGSGPAAARTLNTPPRPMAPPEHRRHVPFSHCSRNQCYDSESGTLVHQDRHGTTVIGPSASGTCIQVGHTLHCR